MASTTFGTISFSVLKYKKFKNSMYTYFLRFCKLTQKNHQSRMSHKIIYTVAEHH